MANSTALPQNVILAPVDRWLVSHFDLVAALVVGGAFAVRLWRTLGTYLNPDEALHFILSNQNSLADAYKASLTNAHPPLYFLLLYFWRFLGNSEVLLRLPSVLAGAGAAWMSFRWIGTVLGQTAALTALLILAFSPTLIVLGAEIRAYSVLLLWMAAALYFVERAFQEQSISALRLHSLFLYLAILTHYSAFWFAIGLGIYGLLRLRDVPRRFAGAWAAFQIGGASIYACLYVTHISRLHGGPMEKEAAGGWLRSFYFQPDVQHPVIFWRDTTVSVFQFLFANSTAAMIAALSFVVGALWLIAAGAVRKRLDRLTAFGILLVLPFALGFLGSLLRVYPYGGTRHSVYLILFAAAGIGWTVAKASSGKLSMVLLPALLLVPYWNRHALPDPQQLNPWEQKRELMTDAIAYLRVSAPTGGLVFTDYQASLLLGYYLDRSQVPSPSTQCGGYREERYGGYRVIVAPVWSATAAGFLPGLAEWSKSCTSGLLHSAIVFDAGWGRNLMDDLGHDAASFIRGRRFGEITSVFEVRISP